MMKSKEIYNNPHLDDIPLNDINENNAILQKSKKIIKLLDKLKYNLESLTVLFSSDSFKKLSVTQY